MPERKVAWGRHVAESLALLGYEKIGDMQTAGEITPEEYFAAREILDKQRINGGTQKTHDEIRDDTITSLSIGREGPDLSKYPEDVRDTIYKICTLWNLSPPSGLRSGKRSTLFGYWITSTRELIEACGNLRARDVLVEVRKDFEQYMDAHKGVAPYTVGGPGSLVKVASAKAGMMREAEKRPKQTELEIARDGSFYF